MAKNLIELKKEIAQMRLDTPIGNRAPVIVKTEFAPGNFNYGVQFWTEDMIAAKSSRNTDSTLSRFVEKL